MCFLLTVNKSISYAGEKTKFIIGLAKQNIAFFSFSLTVAAGEKLPPLIFFYYLLFYCNSQTGLDESLQLLLSPGNVVFHIIYPAVHITVPIHRRYFPNCHNGICRSTCSTGCPGVSFIPVSFLFALTVTLHTSFLPATFAVILVLPALRPVTTPFFDTVAIFFFWDFQVTFLVVPFTFSLSCFPTVTVPFVRFKLIFFFANACSPDNIGVRTSEKQRRNETHRYKNAFEINFSLLVILLLSIDNRRSL